MHNDTDRDFITEPWPCRETGKHRIMLIHGRVLRYLFWALQDLALHADTWGGGERIHWVFEHDSTTVISIRNVHTQLNCSFTLEGKTNRDPNQLLGLINYKHKSLSDSKDSGRCYLLNMLQVIDLNEDQCPYGIIYCMLMRAPSLVRPSLHCKYRWKNLATNCLNHV